MVSTNPCWTTLWRPHFKCEVGTTADHLVPGHDRQPTFHLRHWRHLWLVTGHRLWIFRSGSSRTSFLQTCTNSWIHGAFGGRFAGCHFSQIQGKKDGHISLGMALRRQVESRRRFRFIPALTSAEILSFGRCGTAFHIENSQLRNVPRSQFAASLSNVAAERRTDAAGKDFGRETAAQLAHLQAVFETVDELNRLFSVSLMLGSGYVLELPPVE